MRRGASGWGSGVGESDDGEGSAIEGHGIEKLKGRAVKQGKGYVRHEVVWPQLAAPGSVVPHPEGYFWVTLRKDA